MTNLARAIIIIPTEDIHKTITLGHEKSTAKTGSNFEKKKSRISIPDKFW